MNDTITSPSQNQEHDGVLLTPGSFILIPNAQAFMHDLTHAEMKVYACLMLHAHHGNVKDGAFSSFPSKRKMAKLTGISERHVQRAISGLQEKGLITVRQRWRENGGQSTNLYAIVIQGVSTALPEGQNRPGGGDEIVSGGETKSSPHKLYPINNNSININTGALHKADALSQKKKEKTKNEKPFIWASYLQEMKKHKSANIRLIAAFFLIRGLAFPSRSEAQCAIRRHVKAASRILRGGYSKNAIMAALRYCEKHYGSKGIPWTLETVEKVLTNVPRLELLKY